MLNILNLPDEILTIILNKVGVTLFNINLVNVRLNSLITITDLCSTLKYGLNKALIKASSEGNLSLINELIHSGANTFSKSMVEASKYGHINVVKLMLQQNVIDKSSTINKSMVEASKYGHINVVKLMLQQNGAKLLDWSMCEAAKNGHINIVVMLLGEAENVNKSVKVASRFNHIEIVKRLIEYGADDLNSSIYYAIDNENMDMIKALLQEDVDPKYRTLVHINVDECMGRASEIGNIEIVNLMIKHNAYTFNDSLSRAVIYGKIEVVKLMLRNGAYNIDNAIYHAKCYKHLNIEKLLEDFNCDICKHNHCGTKTPFDFDHFFNVEYKQ